MSINEPTLKQVELIQFAGADTYSDTYNVDTSHLLMAHNLDFVLSEDGQMLCQTRLGTSQIALMPAGDGPVPEMAPWYFSTLSAAVPPLVAAGYEEVYYVAYYVPSAGVKIYDQSTGTFQGPVIPVPGATSASLEMDGARLYAGFINFTGRGGLVGAQVYGNTIGADMLFQGPLINGNDVTVNAATGPAVAPGAGITAGIHMIGFVFTTRNGYTGALCPVASGALAPGAAYLTFTPTQYPEVGEPIPPDGSHSLTVTIHFTQGTLPSFLQGGSSLIQIVMSTAANQSRFFLVPGAAKVPTAPDTSITFDITDGDLTATGTDVTQNQTFLTTTGSTQSPIPPFKPHALFQYSSRMGYCTVDQAGFPVTYFSEQNNYQQLTAAFHGIYLEGRQLPVNGTSLNGVCYIATTSGLYSCQDNGNQPATWIPPARIDGSVGILSPSCMCGGDVQDGTSTGRILLASEKGLFAFRGGAFPQIPLSYWQTSEWNRINWAAPWQVQVVDDVYKQKIRVVAPLKTAIIGASNTNPIVITTKDWHYVSWEFQSQHITISGVSGNTAANGFFTPTWISNTSFSIPVAGNGTYIGGGVVTPDSANVEMTWAYIAGDQPGQPCYSLDFFQGYQIGAVSIIRNINTHIDETWYAPEATGFASSGPALIRAVLPAIDSNIYMDVNTPIYSLGQTCLIPNAQDRQCLLHDYHAAHFRVSGVGAFNIAPQSLDGSIVVSPAASPWGLSLLPGKELLLKWFLRNEQQSIQFWTNAQTNWFRLALIRAYYNDSVPMR